MLNSPDDIVIAVIGTTGAGKSTFIADCTREQTPAIGHKMSSCKLYAVHSLATLTFSGKRRHQQSLRPHHANARAYHPFGRHSGI